MIIIIVIMQKGPRPFGHGMDPFLNSAVRYKWLSCNLQVLMTSMLSYFYFLRQL